MFDNLPCTYLIFIIFLFWQPTFRSCYYHFFNVHFLVQFQLEKQQYIHRIPFLSSLSPKPDCVFTTTKERSSSGSIVIIVAGKEIITHLALPSAKLNQTHPQLFFPCRLQLNSNSRRIDQSSNFIWRQFFLSNCFYFILCSFPVKSCYVILMDNRIKKVLTTFY